MTRTTTIFACTLALSISTAAVAQTKAPTTKPANAPATKPTYTPEALRERYKVLTERNMFLRDRTPRPTTPSRGFGPGFGTREFSTPPRPDPEKYFVVRGCTIEDKDGHYRTVQVEQLGGSGGFLTLAEGDEVARGKVVKIEKDGIEYEYGGRRVWIALGSDLTGTAYVAPALALAPTTPPPAAPTTAPSTQPADGAGPATMPLAGGDGSPPASAMGTGPAPSAVPINTANLSLEERMRLRRLQEGQR